MKHEQWVQIAKMYYIEHMTQEEIADKLYISRSSISRILTKCHEEGIIEVTVNDPMTCRPEAAYCLKRRFGLKNVIITPTGRTPEKTVYGAGRLIATHLLQMLKDGMSLGVGRGKVLYQVARNIQGYTPADINVVQMQGGVSAVNASDDGQALTAAFSSKLRGRAYVIHAPLLVKSKQTKQLLSDSQVIREVLLKQEELDIALAEIERPRINLGKQLREPWLTNADALQLKDQKAAACICGYYLDANGASCNVGINDRLMAIDFDTLRRVDTTIGIALGPGMLSAVTSVLRNGVINTLVIDESLSYALEAYEQD